MLQTYLTSPSAYPYQVALIYELFDEPYLQGGAFFTQEGLYQVNESSGGYITLGAPKPVYQSIQQILADRYQIILHNNLAQTQHHHSPSRSAHTSGYFTGSSTR